MKEQNPRNPEHFKLAPERSKEHEGAQHEHEPVSAEKERLRRQETAENARRTAEQESVSVEKPSNEIDEIPIRITKADKQRAYTLSLSRVQSRLPATSKRFSKVIHNQAIERSSEVLEKTIARPSGILGGSLVAALGLGVMLFFARRNGFALSGSELLLFLSAGWILGVGAEGLMKLIRRRR